MFKDYLNEVKYTMGLMTRVEDVSRNIINALKAIESLKDKYNINDNANRLSGNINLSNQINKIEIKLKNIGNDVEYLQNTITGGGTVSNQIGSWGGPE